jgi:hypothetical protein
MDFAHESILTGELRIMCVMLRELLVPLSDLQFIVMACTACKAEITFDLLYEVGSKAQRASATPHTCPACDARFDQRGEEMIDALRKAFKAILSQDSMTVSFRVRPDLAEGL